MHFSATHQPPLLFMFIFNYSILHGSIFQVHFSIEVHDASAHIQWQVEFIFLLTSQSHWERVRAKKGRILNCRRDRMRTIFRVRSFIAPRSGCPCTHVRRTLSQYTTHSRTRTEGQNTATMEAMNESQMHWQKREITTTTTKQNRKKSRKTRRRRSEFRLDWSDSGCWHWHVERVQSTTVAANRGKKNGLFEAERGQMSMFSAAHGKLLCTDEIGDEWEQQQQHGIRNTKDAPAAAAAVTYWQRQKFRGLCGVNVCSGLCSLVELNWYSILDERVRWDQLPTRQQQSSVWHIDARRAKTSVAGELQEKRSNYFGWYAKYTRTKWAPAKIIYLQWSLTCEQASRHIVVFASIKCNR